MFLKRNKKQYGKFHPKETETISWDTLCEDLIDKYQFKSKRGGKKFEILPKRDEKKYKMTTKSVESVHSQSVTMIDPAIGWIEICTVPSAQRDLVSNQVDLTWLAHYPLPNKVIMDRGNEFIAEFKEIVINAYGTNIRPITSRNPNPTQYYKECNTHFQSTKHSTG